jgi:hypothetical protein
MRFGITVLTDPRLTRWTVRHLIIGTLLQVSHLFSTQSAYSSPLYLRTYPRNPGITIWERGVYSLALVGVVGVGAAFWFYLSNDRGIAPTNDSHSE